MSVDQTTDVQSQKSSRLTIYDKNNNIHFLINTGADLSVCPPSRLEKINTTSYKLFAANGTPIPTYGQKMSLNLGLRREFNWPFVIADISKAIIGADFLKHYNLLVDLKKQHLIDATTGIKIIATVTNIPNTDCMFTTFDNTNTIYNKVLPYNLNRFSPLKRLLQRFKSLKFYLLFLINTL